MNSVRAVLGTLLLCACHRPVASPATTKEEPARYYPGWIGAISMHVDAVRACTADRLGPTLVLDVSSRPSGATGVRSVDGMGIVERCAVKDGAIVHRSRDELPPDMLVRAGLPVFALGLEPPTVASHVLLEDVRGDDGALLGWLFWPAEQRATQSEERHAASE